jgi:hypothetical protein
VGPVKAEAYLSGRDKAKGIALYEKFGFAIVGTTHRLFALRNGE